jgi:hypothetical protein
LEQEGPQQKSQKQPAAQANSQATGEWQGSTWLSRSRVGVAWAGVIATTTQPATHYHHISHARSAAHEQRTAVNKKCNDAIHKQGGLGSLL